MHMLLFRLIASLLALIGGSSAVSAQEVYVPEEQQRQLFEAAQQSEQDEIQGVINLFSNVLGYSYPKNFVPVYQVRQPAMFMLEFIPYGEDVRTNWSRMLTIQAIPAQVAERISSAGLAASFGPRLETGCAGDSAFENLGELELRDTTAHRVSFACTSDGRNEATILQVTKRNDDIIIVQFAKRDPTEADEAALMSDADASYFAALLDRLEFSDNPAAAVN